MSAAITSSSSVTGTSSVNSIPDYDSDSNDVDVSTPKPTLCRKRNRTTDTSHQTPSSILINLLIKFNGCNDILMSVI